MNVYVFPSDMSVIMPEKWTNMPGQSIHPFMRTHKNMSKENAESEKYTDFY